MSYKVDPRARMKYLKYFCIAPRETCGSKSGKSGIHAGKSSRDNSKIITKTIDNYTKYLLVPNTILNTLHEMY